MLWPAAVLVAALMDAWILKMACGCVGDYLQPEMLALAGVILFLMMLFLLRASGSVNMQLLLGACAAVAAFLGGVYVNPVQHGIEELTGSTPYQMVQEVVEEDPQGLWIVENTAYPLTNLPITAGAPTINSTNVYPNLERWELLDPDHSDEEIYNRYAHIRIDLTEEETKFIEGETPDVFSLQLNYEDLETLDVSYILATRDLSGYSGNELKLEELDHQGEVWIYRVDYIG